LKHIIPRGSYQVIGVTSLGNELFVVRQTAQQQIEVYDTTNFTLQRKISVHQLVYAYGLTSCGINKCLYVSNYGNQWLHRVDLSNSAATYWAVGATPAGLFVNSVNNVLVTCNGENSVREYTTQGTMVRQIRFQSGISSPWHVVQLSNDQFAVTHSNRICIVNNQGIVVHSYGNASVAGSAPGQMNTPKGLMRVSNDCLLVADSNNNRMVLLTPTLDRTLYLTLPIDGGLQCPWGFFFDVTRGRLFIGEYSGYRVPVFDNVYCTDLS
jgi:DNA-binding beta-propeller fold protein YncE